ncbi:MAG: hypothetical protein LBQ54_08185 [Planctomycetaceae bacterium]|jgi:hypothetical protein|nr:hypothetical protein [Planctomycetaceae bacterium]
MPKILCLFALVISALLLLLFFADIAVGVPFGRSLMLDAAFIIAAGIIGTLSFLTFREY